MADLVQRLRDWECIYPEDQDEPDHCLYLKAADRIEELEADNKGLRHMILDQINSTGDDPEIMAATRAEWAARALVAEAKLAKAVELETVKILVTSAYKEGWSDCSEAISLDIGWEESLTRTTLAELKGDSDEQTTDSNDY